MGAGLRLLIIIALFSAAYRMDEQYRPMMYKVVQKSVIRKYKYNQYICVSPFLKSFLIFRDKEHRNEFLFAAVCQELFSYVWTGVSVLALIIGHNSSYAQQRIEVYLYYSVGIDLAIICAICSIYKLRK